MLAGVPPGKMLPQFTETSGKNEKGHDPCCCRQPLYQEESQLEADANTTGAEKQKGFRALSRIPLSCWFVSPEVQPTPGDFKHTTQQIIFGAAGFGGSKHLLFL